LGGDDIAGPRCAVGIGLAQVCRQPTSCRSPAKADELTLSPLGLIARIYEVFPLVCPICGGPMRIIAFITYSADIRQILEHIGVDAEPPRV
jgi:hypothetical protein